MQPLLAWGRGGSPSSLQGPCRRLWLTARRRRWARSAGAPPAPAFEAGGPEDAAAAVAAEPQAAASAEPQQRHPVPETAADLLALLAASIETGVADERLALTALQLAAQRRGDPSFFSDAAELDAALAQVERLLRRNLVALTPGQLGLACRSYVALGGGSRVLLAALQDEACNWGPDDYGLPALADLIWGLAWAGQGCTPAFAQHLEGVVQHVGRDWRGWAAGARPARLALLLWGLASLRAQPCEALLDAVCWRLARVPLHELSTKSLVTLLWALARLGAAAPDVEAAVAAVSEEVCARLEQQLADQPPLRPFASVPGAEQPLERPQRLRQQQRTADRAAVTAVAAEAAAATLREAVDGRWEGPSAAQAASATQTHGGGSWVEEEEALAGGVAAWEVTSLSDVPPWQEGAEAAAEDSMRLSGSGSDWAQQEQQQQPGPAVDPARALGTLGGAAEGGLSPALLSTLVWSWGKLGHLSSECMRAATLLLYGCTEELAPADVSRVLWGLAELEYSQPQLLGALCARLRAPRLLAGFSMQQLATTLYAFSAMDYFPGEPLLDRIADRCRAARGHFEPRALCHVLWSLARLGYEDELFYLHFVPTIFEDIDRYGPAELADLSRVYARFGLEPEGLFEAIARRTVAAMPSADIQDLLRILTAFNQLGLQPEALLDAVEIWADQRLRQLSPQALTLALGTFARLGGPRSPSLLASAAECVVAQLERFEPGQLALVTWSFAKLGYHASEVLDAAVARLVSGSGRFSDKGVSNVLWALATLRHPLPHAAHDLDRIAARLQGRLRTFGAQSLSTIAWVYATLGHRPAPAFLQELGDAATGQVQAFEPQGLGLLVWALASLGHRHDPLLQSIDAYCGGRGRLRGFEAQHVSNLLWGMAKVGYQPGQAFWKSCAQEAALLVADLNPQELFNVTWAFAKLRLHPRRLIGALAAEAARRPSSFSSQELSGLLWALAVLGHRGSAGAEALLAASEAELEKRAGEFEDRHLATLVWAWGRLRHVPGGRAAAAVRREAAERAAGLDPQALRMLATGFAALHLDPGPQLAPKLAARGVEVAQLMRPPECAGVLESWLALGLRDEARQLLERLAATPAGDGSRGSKSGGGASLLDAAAEAAPPSTAIRLLLAMAVLGDYPETAFAKVRARLKAASPQYNFTRQDLLLLGAALDAADEAHRARLKINPRILEGVQAAAAAAASAAAVAEGGDGRGSSREDGTQWEEVTGRAGISQRGWFPPTDARDGF